MQELEGRAYARPSSRLIVAAVATAALVVGGCRSPLDRGRAPEASQERRPELGKPAETLPPESAGRGSPSTTVAAGSGASSGPSRPGATTTTQSRPASSRGTANDDIETPLAAIDDPGPPDGGAPSYADLRRVAFVDVGRTLRVTVDVDAPFPALKPREVMGLGIDLHRSSDQESDFQLFADGGANGWRAYLQTPEGFVEYPGTFALGGSTIVFEVPWAALGGEKAVRASSFVDWSSRDGLLPQSGGDRAPDRGTVTISPAPSGSS